MLRGQFLRMYQNCRLNLFCLKVKNDSHTRSALRKPKLSRKFEPLVLALLAAASGVAVLTTIGIVLSVVYESLRFFAEVSPLSFLFGTEWAPTAEPGRFGILPLMGGTLLITLIAIAVAAPLGLFSAIYLAEYANATARKWIKPMLELLAGIPTVVLGFFAALDRCTISSAAR